MRSSERRVTAQLVGAAGEHLVLSRLLSRGILAAQAPRGTRKADILVNHLDGKAPCLIQVKTRSGKGADGGWHMKAKHEDIKDKAREELKRAGLYPYELATKQ